MISGLITPIASLLGTVVETQMVKQKSKQKILEDVATHDNKGTVNGKEYEQQSDEI